MQFIVLLLCLVTVNCAPVAEFVPLNDGQSIVVDGSDPNSVLEGLTQGIKAALVPANPGLQNPDIVSRFIATKILSSMQGDQGDQVEVLPAQQEEYQTYSDTETEDSPVDVEFVLSPYGHNQMYSDYDNQAAIEPKSPTPRATVHSKTDRFYTHSEEDRVIF
ncbi:uncharacterized protein LOC141850006 [Brevipalpus obovatus]|uniref:uncharacterized protein LOC141850006 n=1 Tax=Brevipalpus obovatus TaxID=246614 RepID=UPI003D9EF182